MKPVYLNHKYFSVEISGLLHRIITYNFILSDLSLFLCKTSFHIIVNLNGDSCTDVNDCCKMYWGKKSMRKVLSGCRPFSAGLSKPSPGGLHNLGFLPYWAEHASTGFLLGYFSLGGQKTWLA